MIHITYRLRILTSYAGVFGIGQSAFRCLGRLYYGIRLITAQLDIEGLKLKSLQKLTI